MDDLSRVFDPPLSKQAVIKGLLRSAYAHGVRAQLAWREPAVAKSLLDTLVEKIDAAYDAFCEEESQL